MQIGTEELNCTPTGAEHPSRWWIWKAGRRRYSFAAPVADKEASSRRRHRRRFQLAYQKACRPSTVRSVPTMRTLVRQAQARKLAEKRKAVVS